ncbi:hypothetical protein ACHAAC_03665 [Aeromicrobium sp. CF4.19]|uniref:hypothetical protein n=1 Tax=Aeromicrobium sp. CF4.19 TaxID=3373082 RepID=UPI003EE5B495
MSTRTPARRPVVTWPALLLGIALVALAVAGLRDLAVTLGWIDGRAGPSPRSTRATVSPPDRSRPPWVSAWPWWDSSSC